MAFSRVIWIVLDSVGIGEMPDAADWGDVGSNTLGNIARIRGIHLPNLARLGLGNIMPLAGIAPAGGYGRCTLASLGKDTTTGRWEMAGIHLAKPFPIYPRGFPPEAAGWSFLYHVSVIPAAMIVVTTVSGLFG